MAADEFKALTYINLPFIEERYAPGKMIPRSSFDALAEAAAAANPDGENLTADEQIKELMHWGSISDDPDMEIHPDHRPVDPGQPTLARMVEEARLLVKDLQERGEEIPKELTELADVDRQIVSGSDAGNGGDKQ